MSKKVLVTGANGYIAMHVVDLLLKQGHQVRGTIRNLNDKEKVESIKKLGQVELFEANLLDSGSWKKAVQDVDIVFHVASPLPVVQPTDENEIIKPAVEGTINVFKAALEANVKRVVLTSSGLTVCGYDYQERTYSEADWVDIANAKTAYQKSKILAEKAAWNFVNERRVNNQACFDLAVVIPVFVLGPVLNAFSGSSVTRFLKMFDQNVEKLDNLHFATCDVRDVALGHVKAAFTDEAIGQRNMIVSSNHLISMKYWENILNEVYAPKSYKITRVVEQDDEKKYQGCIFDNSRMRNILGIKPTDFRSTIIDMTESLINYGLIKH